MFLVSIRGLKHFAYQSTLVEFRWKKFASSTVSNDAPALPKWPSSLSKSFVFGEPGGARTRDPVLKRHMLYHLSYRPNIREVSNLLRWPFVENCRLWGILWGPQVNLAPPVQQSRHAEIVLGCGSIAAAWLSSRDPSYQASCSQALLPRPAL